MIPGTHCKNVTATLTAGQFLKGTLLAISPSVSGQRAREAERGAGTRLCTNRDVSIK